MKHVISNFTWYIYNSNNTYNALISEHLIEPLLNLLQVFSKSINSMCKKKNLCTAPLISLQDEWLF